MKIFIRMLLWGVAAVALVAAPTQALQQATALRHLTYDFTFENTTDTTQHDSGIGGPVSGYSDSRAGTGDKGVISVDVMAAPADRSLIVSISEQAREDREAVAATCSVWGNTVVVCDPTKKVTEEEFALLRFLGRSFISPAQLDAKGHWSVGTSKKDLTITSDFTIDKTVGTVDHVVESRVVKQVGAQGFVTTTDGQITYDTAMSIPSDVVEQSTTRQNIGMGDYQTDSSQLHLKLDADSLAPKPVQ